MSLPMALPVPEKRLRPLTSAPADGLVVHEIYASVQGESTYAGVPCTFVRTTACNLRCRYCDTPHAFTQGEPMSLDAIVARVASLGPRTVEITGGEPLLQTNVLPLMQRLCDAGYRVLLETSGSIDISPVDPRVIRIVDFKSPSSGELEANYWPNVAALRPHDEVKLVLGDRQDYEWAKAVIREHDLAKRCTVLLGPIWGSLDAKELVGWINEDHLPVRLNLQLHKFIWDPKQRGV
jgi:7-carboxy-7-deazaguanine synthase